MPTLTGNVKLDTAISGMSAVIAWISLREAQVALAIMASCIAIVSGTLAGINHFMQIIKRLKQDKDVR